MGEITPGIHRMRRRGGRQIKPLMADFLRDHEGQPGCWEYPGAQRGGGYAIYIHERRGQNARSAHIVALEFANGPIPAGLNVCHSCDNPPCCKPSHLFAGTDKDNNQDAKTKGRNSRGERNGCSKLIAEQILAIRADGRMGIVVAQQYGITPTSVSRIRLRKAWTHL